MWTLLYFMFSGLSFEMWLFEYKYGETIEINHLVVSVFRSGVCYWRLWRYLYSACISMFEVNLIAEWLIEWRSFTMCENLMTLSSFFHKFDRILKQYLLTFISLHDCVWFFTLSIFLVIINNIHMLFMWTHYMCGCCYLILDVSCSCIQCIIDYNGKREKRFTCTITLNIL